MPELKPLDVEVFQTIIKYEATRWTDIKRNLPKETLGSLNDKSIDVYLSRSLKRLKSLGYIYKDKQTNKHPRHYLTCSGALLAYKLKNGIALNEPIKSRVLAFGFALQWFKNQAIRQSRNDTVEEYFKNFKEEINRIDFNRFIEEAAALEATMMDDKDFWDDSRYVKYLENREFGVENDPSIQAFLDEVFKNDAEMRAKSSKRHRQDPS